MESTLDRIKKYIDYKGLSVRAFEQSVNLSNGSFASQLKNNKTIGVDKLEYILQVYNEVNPSWLLTGKGTMLLDGKNYAKKTPSATTVNFKLEDFNELLKQNNELLTENNRFLKLQIERLNKEIISLKKENKSDTSYSLVAEPQPKLKK